MKFPILLAVPLLCLAAAPPPDLEPLLQRARSLPGEFTADALLRIAALDNLDKTRKIALLDEAFRRAAESPEPYRRRATMAQVASSAGFFNRAFDQDLDALSLRLRTIEALLSLDPPHARDLFLQIPSISLPRLKCSTFLVYDVDRYYQVLGRIARDGFTAAQIENGEALRLLTQQAGAIASPAQVIPMARVIAESKIKDPGFQQLVAAYTAALGKITGDDRSFTYAHSTGSAIFSLTEELKSRKLSPLPLLEAYRLYLVENLSAERCADDSLMLNTPQSFGLDTAAPTPVTNPAEFFNLTMRIPPLQLIQEGEIQPAKVDGVAEGLESCTGGTCKDLAKQYRSLIFRDTGAAFSNADRQSEDWQTKLKSFLNTMAFWQPKSPADAPYFRDKCILYTDLLSIVPTPENRQTVARALMDFVEPSPFQKVSPIQWFFPVNALLGRIALDPNGLGKLLPTLTKSHDPLVALYAQLETLAPRTPDRIMPLL